jgi:hypothetical protein
MAGELGADGQPQADSRKKIKMPDGKVVAFPADMPDDEIKALIESKYPKEVKAANAPKKTLASEAVDYASQGISGVNEGMYNLAGFPVDALNDFVIGPAMAGINAVAGTDMKPSDKPFLGSKMIKETLAPTIAPPSDDMGKQIVRRVGEEVGAAFIPGVGLASKSAKAGAVIGNTLKGAVGSGTGAAVAEQVFPGNPLAEFAGQVIGGGVTGALGGMKRARAGVAPTAEDLKLMKEVAYKQSDALGVKYTPKSYQGMAANVDAAVKADNISPTRHPKAFSFVEDMKTRGTNGMTMTELDQLRQEVRRDLLRSSDEAERHFGKVIIRQIDDYIAKAGAGDVSSGSASDAAGAITKARELNTRYRKTELIEDAIYDAGLDAASAGSGGNINNSIRQQLKRILKNDTDRAAFTADEIKEMELVVKQGTGEELLRLVGRLSPSGNGLMALLGLIGTVANPSLVAIPAAGLMAKTAADLGTKAKISTLRRNVATGKPSPTYQPARSGAALYVGQAANANASNQDFRDLRRKAVINSL